MKAPIDRFFPESAVGGYSRVDGTVEFYSRINALLEPDKVVLDFGAGRGVSRQEDPSAYRRGLLSLGDRCRRVIGVDVDSAVRENPGLHEAHVIAPNSRIPLEDESVDLIVSDWVLEHVDDPAFMAEEFSRVLKPGGWVCARTPNRWGYIGIATNLVPNRLHETLLRRAQPDRKAKDVFPTRYRINTRSKFRQYFDPGDWSHYSYGHFSEPAYFGNSRLLWGLMLLSFRLTPEFFAPVWLVFMRKKQD